MILYHSEYFPDAKNLNLPFFVRWHLMTKKSEEIEYTLIKTYNRTLLFPL